jgi:hypothetical protein
VQAPGDADKNQLYWHRNADSYSKYQSESKVKPGVTGVPKSQPKSNTVKPPARGSRHKPDYLREIKTTAIACKPDIHYRKLQPDSNDYNTMFELPEAHDLVDIKERMG